MRAATAQEERALCALMERLVPPVVALCATGCGRQVPACGVRCVRCENRRRWRVDK